MRQAGISGLICSIIIAAHRTSVVRLLERFSRLLERPVDVLDWKAVETSRNPFRRRAILGGMRLLYVA